MRTGKLYHLRLRVECTLFCNLQSRAQTHAVLVIGELLLSLFLSKRLIYSFVANEFAPLFWGKVHVLCSPLRFSRVSFFFTPIYFVRGSYFIHDICIYTNSINRSGFTINCVFKLNPFLSESKIGIRSAATWLIYLTFTYVFIHTLHIFDWGTTIVIWIQIQIQHHIEFSQHLRHTRSSTIEDAVEWSKALDIRLSDWCCRTEPPTMGKQLVNFITCSCESSAPFLVIYKDGREPTPYCWCFFHH
jgi:hypothetical protein